MLNTVFWTVENGDRLPVQRLNQVEGHRLKLELNRKYCDDVELFHRLRRVDIKV